MTNKKAFDIQKRLPALPQPFPIPAGVAQAARSFHRQGESMSRLIGQNGHASRLTKLMAPRLTRIDDFRRATAWPQQLNKMIGNADRYRAMAQQLAGPLAQYRQLFDVVALDWLKDGRLVDLVRRQQFLESCREHGWVPHPSLYTWIEDGALNDNTEEFLHSKWDSIAKELTETARPSVTTPHRAECIRQLLHAQGERLFVVVCRSAYPEIEALAREHIQEDPDLRVQVAGLSPKERARRISSERQRFFSRDRSPFLGLSISDLGGMLGVEVATMLLDKVFARCWSEDELSEEDRAVSRHYHAHGFPLDATFKDGLNAILLLDAALRAFDALKRSKAPVSAVPVETED